MKNNRLTYIFRLPVADDQTWRNYIFGYSYCIAFCTMGTVVWCLTDSLFFSLCLYKKGLFKDIELAIHDCVDGEETRYDNFFMPKMLLVFARTKPFLFLIF